MRLSVKAMAIALSLIWGGAIACTGLVHLAIPSYAASFLEGVGSIYLGFHGARTFGDVVLGTAYALVGGAFGGLIFGWLYNAFASQSS